MEKDKSEYSGLRVGPIAQDADQVGEAKKKEEGGRREGKEKQWLLVVTYPLVEHLLVAQC